jgi:hypothetical protein
MRKITEEDIREAFAPLKTFLIELSNTAEIIGDMRFPDDGNKAAQIENITVTRIVKRCGRNIADATGYALRNPIKTMRSLSRAQADKLAAAAAKDRAAEPASAYQARAAEPEPARSETPTPERSAPMGASCVPFRMLRAATIAPMGADSPEVGQPSARPDNQKGDI